MLTLLTRLYIPFAAGYFVSYLYRSVNAVIAPNLSGDLGIAAADLGLLTSVYFIAFASFQMPLGVLLDRFGPRRVEAGLLVIAAAGAGVFATAEGLGGLLLGRALIGFGVSACLMAALQAMVLWLPRERLPLANGLILMAGGMGALGATAPVELALTVMSWRGVFLWLAGATLVVALLLFAVVPERRRDAPETDLRAQALGLLRIFTSPEFWRIAPLHTVSQATALSMQGLWAGPWLRDVTGLDRAATAGHLAALAAGMTAGFVLMGAAAERLGRLGIRPIAVAGGGMFAYMLVQFALILDISPWPLPVWIAFGLLGTSGSLGYAILSQYFPPHFAGRVNTSLNLLVFIAAFVFQWGMGAVIGLGAQAEGYAPWAYRAALAIPLALQAAAFVWYAAPRRVAARAH